MEPTQPSNPTSQIPTPVPGMPQPTAPPPAVAVTPVAAQQPLTPPPPPAAPTNQLSMSQTSKHGVNEVGYAASINDYLIWLNGLPNIKINEIVMTKDGARGLVTAVKNNQVEILMLDDSKIQPNTMFTRTYQQLSIEAGTHLIGRTVNPLGLPIDGKGRFVQKGELTEIERPALGIKSRATITRQFETGIAMVDMLIPMAFGQRELMMGDPRSGKTGFLIDIITNQKGKDIICILALVGKPIIEIRRLVDILGLNGALDYTIIVAASSSEKAPLIFVTPQVAVTLAEHFQRQGKDVLLIMDDMGVHAKFYREISLLSGTAPGRESYPGDIFYQHAKLVERCGNFNKQFGGGSITCLPVIEIAQDDYSAYMPTNLMGMTDGHFLFSSNRYHQGYRPSVDISLSVSRVGRQTQNLAQKQLADRVKALLAEAKKLESFSRMGSEVSAQTLNTLKQAGQIEEILKQAQLTKLPIAVQMIMLGLVFTKFFMSKEASFVQKNKQALIDYLTNKFNHQDYIKQIKTFKSDQEFIDNLNGLTPQLEPICQAVTEPVAAPVTPAPPSALATPTQDAPASAENNIVVEEISSQKQS